MKAAVLAGGVSTEREISLASARCVVKALEGRGHQVTAIDPGEGWRPVELEQSRPEHPRTSCGLPGPEGIRVLREARIVFNMLHGGQGEDGTLNALLELLEAPYVGSPPGASAAAMDKVVSKRLFAAVGVPTPPYLVLEPEREDGWREALEQARLGLPAIVKPATQGSSVSLTKAESPEQLLEGVRQAAAYGQVLVESFVQGRELTVGVLGEEALPVLEVVVPGGLYDFQAKYRSSANRYVCPAEIPEEAAARARELALRAFRVLGLRDYARIDFLLDRQGELWCLEANNQPGMTDSSLLPKSARVLGLDLGGLLERLAAHALARRGLEPSLA